MAEKQKKWYDKELISREGDVILLYGEGSQLKHNESIYDSYIWFGSEDKAILKDDCWKNNATSEIFVSYLAKLLGLPSVEVRPAVAIKNAKEKEIIKGILVESYKMKDIAFSFKAEDANTGNKVNTVDNIIKNLQNYVEYLMDTKPYMASVALDPNLETDLLKLFVLDYITCEIDRNDGNILFYAFVDNEQNYTMKLGKIFDNSQAFFFTDDEYKKFKKYLKNDEKFNELVDKRYSPALIFEDEEDKLYEFTSVITPKLVSRILKNPEVFHFYEKIKTIKFEQILKLIHKDMPEYKIPKFKYEVAQKVFNHRKELLIKEMQLQKMQILTQPVAKNEQREISL